MGVEFNYLENGGRSKNCLWALDETKQIKKMVANTGAAGRV